MHAYSMRQSMRGKTWTIIDGVFPATGRASRGRGQPARHAGSNFMAMPLMQ